MSSNHSEHTSSNKRHSIEGSLPPRRSKHGRDNEHQSEEEGFEKPKRFPIIQMILFAFIALIAAFLVFYFWQQYKAEQPLTTESNVDTVARVNQQDQGSSSEPPEGDVSFEDDGDINNEEEQDDNKEELSDNEQENKESSVEQDQDMDQDQEQDQEQDLDQNQTGVEPKKGSVRTMHTIQPGETMYSITRKYFGSHDYIDFLAEFNDIKDIREIQSGMKLKIPEKP